MPTRGSSRRETFDEPFEDLDAAGQDSNSDGQGASAAMVQQIGEDLEERLGVAERVLALPERVTEVVTVITDLFRRRRGIVRSISRTASIWIC